MDEEREKFHRSTLEIMILIFAVTVSFSIVAAGATVAIIEIRDPSADTVRVSEVISTLITAILGALLGLIAGKNEPKKE